MKTENCRVTAHPTTGLIFTQSIDDNGQARLDKNHQPYGYIRISQPRFDMKFAYLNGGVRDVSALKAISLKAWNNVKDFYKPNMEIGGKVRIMETTEADLPGYQIKRAGNGINGELGEILTTGGLPIWRKTEHVEDDSLEDILLKHDNVISTNTVTTNISKGENDLGVKLIDETAQNSGLNQRNRSTLNTKG